MISATINRLATGVPGLDDVLGGGVPEFSFNLIAGSPGCGKTTLSHQMMFAMASEERPALYMTVLGEPPLKMLRYQQQFGFFDADQVTKSIRFINLSDDAAEGDLEQVLARIAREVEQHNPSLVFVDSFRSVVLASRDGERSVNSLQRFMQKLGMLMTSWQATTFLIGEYVDEAEANPIMTVADGFLLLRQSVQRNSMVRKLEVVKMRGQANLPGLHSFRISDSGIEVFGPPQIPEAPPHDNRLSDVQERVFMGIPHLDEMLGGGLPRGYSLLVAGPSGSGKSNMAAAFLMEGARCGETGVLVAFEQHPNRSRNRVLVDLIASGSVGVVETLAADVSIDEILLLILRKVQQLGATRIVIDSLSGFALAIAPTYRDDFRESLARLATSLSRVGLTVLMTSELEDRYTDLRFSPYGTAFMTDAIIVHRYIEVDSRLRRVMAVVKLRASAHSDELREFHIDDRGIRIGEVLTDHEGLLGGRPTRKQSSDRDPADPAFGTR